jgi:hypothetical protein
MRGLANADPLLIADSALGLAPPKVGVFGWEPSRGFFISNDEEGERRRDVLRPWEGPGAARELLEGARE